MSYRTGLLALFLFASFFPSICDAQTSSGNNFISYQNETQEIINKAMDDDQAFETLTYFVDKFGHRFSGSESLENSIDWIVSKMKAQPFDRITTQQVMVPHWIRGEESATLTASRTKNMPMLGLGGSISIPEGGIEANVLVVESFSGLKQKADQAEGKSWSTMCPLPLTVKLCSIATGVLSKPQKLGQWPA